MSAILVAVSNNERDLVPKTSPEPEEQPPVPPVGGGASRMLMGLVLRRRAVLSTPKCEKSVGRRGSAPDPAGGSLQRSPRPSSWWEGFC